MKRLIFLLLTVAALPAQQSFVQESTTAFFAAGPDAGATRVHWVDKGSGDVRTGLVGSGGAISWEPVRTTGVTDVTGAALYRTGGGASDLLAIASATNNRLEVPGSGTAGGSALALSNGVGPAVLAGLEPGLLQPSFVVATLANDAPDRFRLHTHNVNGNTGAASAVSTPPRAANRVRVKTTAAAQAALVHGGSLHVTNAVGTSAPASVAAFVLPQPDAARWTYGWFKPTATEPRSQFIDFVPGESVVRVRQVTEALPGQYAFAAAVEFDLGAPLEQVSVLPLASSSRLVAVFSDGSAALFAFDGVSAPSTLASYAAIGSEFALPVGNGRFALVSGTEWRVHDGAAASPSAVPLASGLLPTLRPGAAAQNVFVLEGEPFADPLAHVVGGNQFDQWTTVPAFPDGQPRPLSAAQNVRSDVFSDEESGLTLLTAARTVPAQAGNRFLLPNQHRADASVASFLTPVQATRADIVFSPAPGTYAPALPQPGDTAGDAAAAVTVRITATDAGTVLWREVGGDTWAAVPVGGISITSTTTLEARTATSPLRRATYTVAGSSLEVPTALDADLNGLADAWEQTFAQTDPNADPDGDGFNNLSEQNAGSDPLDALSVPPTGLEDVQLASETSADGATLTISWPAGVGPVVLQVSPDFVDWQPVDPQPAANVYTTPLSEERAFYRLVRP